MQNREQTKIEQILKQWQSLNLPAKPHIVRYFHQGLNHQTALIQSAQQQFVIKYYQQSICQKTIGLQDYLAKLGITAHLIHQSNQCVITPYLGDTIKPSLLNNELKNKTIIKCIATTLATLHQIDIKHEIEIHTNFDYRHYQQDYLARIDFKRFNHIPIQKIKNRIEPIIESYASIHDQKCICHNDLVLENMIYQPNKLFLIDWDFAQYNHALFDLAAVCVYCNLTAQQQKNLFAQYQMLRAKNYLEKDIAYAKVAVLWLDFLWYLAIKPELADIHAKQKVDALNTLIKDCHHLET